MMELGEMMATIRLQAGLTQLEVARKMRASPKQIVRWESGKNLPNMNSLLRFAEANGKRLDIRFLNPRK